MAKVYTAEEFANKAGYDIAEQEATKKKKAEAAKKAREAKAKKSDGYMAPSGSTEKAAE